MADNNKLMKIGITTYEDIRVLSEIILPICGTDYYCLNSIDSNMAQPRFRGCCFSRQITQYLGLLTINFIAPFCIPLKLGYISWYAICCSYVI